MTDDTRTKPAVDAGTWQEVIVVSTTADLFGNHLGLPLPQAMRKGDGAIRFAGSASGVSRKSVPARPGQAYRATGTLRVEGSGDPVQAHFGPMFLDARDNVLFHSRVIPVAAPGQDQALDVEVVAPPGTVAVRLRMVGGWAEGKDSSGFTYAYGVARLFRNAG